VVDFKFGSYLVVTKYFSFGLVAGVAAFELFSMPHYVFINSSRNLTFPNRTSEPFLSAFWIIRRSFVTKPV
jgi:hypothetical protein